MKSNHRTTFLGLSLAAFFTAASSLLAAPLNGTSAVQSKPEPKAPAIAYLKAGTEPVPATGYTGTVPAGWMAVELSGPFSGYVTNNDISKNLDIEPGVAIRLEPKADATVLTTMQKGDVAAITGIPKGKWMQVEVKKKIVGFINLTPSSAMPTSAGPAMPMASTPKPMMPASSSSVMTAGRPAPSMDLGDGGWAALPRLFQGRFVSTHRPLAPKRPYEYALNDDSGTRLGYVDVSKLLQTEQIEKYVDRIVVLYGTAKNEPDAKSIVIRAESLQLK